MTDQVKSASTKAETFSAAGPYKVKYQVLPGGTAHTSDAINLVKVPLKKSPEDLVPVDPLEKTIQTLMLLQLLANRSGAKPVVPLDAAGPLLGARLMMEQKTARDSAETLHQLVGRDVQDYAKRLIRALTPEHYAEAGGVTPEETIDNLIQDVIPRHLIREHATRIGRGNTDLGTKLIEQHLSRSLDITGEPLPAALKRMLAKHITSINEASQRRALLDLPLDMPGPATSAIAAPAQPTLANWMEIIQRAAPKPEHKPSYEARTDQAVDAAKYGSAGRSILRGLRTVLTSPLTIGLAAAAIPSLLPMSSLKTIAMTGSIPLPRIQFSKLFDELGFGLAGFGLGGLAHYLAGPRKLDLSDTKVAPFYQSAGGKAHALTVDPAILRSVFTESPQVGALARAAGPKTLDALGLAGDPTLVGGIRRFMRKLTGHGNELANATQVLRHLVYATHGDISKRNWRDHLETITGRSGRHAGKFLADILRAAAVDRGALGSLSPARSALEAVKVDDDFTNMMRQALTQQTMAQQALTPQATAPALSR